MSSFDCKIRRVTSVINHPNADRLSLVQVGGYYSVAQKGNVKEGDLVLYVQEDTVFTDLEIAKLMKVDTYLTGKKKNRVKAIRLRGCLSQGICVPFDAVDEITSSLGHGYISRDSEGYDLAEWLKVEKYEEPIPVQMAGQARRWPEFLPHYDIENVKRPESFNLLQEGEAVVVTEKLHGTNIAIAIGPGLEEGEEAFVCSRNYALKEDANNVYWRAAKNFDLIKKLREIQTNDPYHHDETISLHGEVVGVQDLKYGLEGGEISFYAFDIMIDGKFVNYDKFKLLCHHWNIPTVPVLYHGPYNYETINNIIQGNTTLPGGHIKEGGVCKPVVERNTLSGERVQVKFISENYLLRSSGTEFH